MHNGQMNHQIDNLLLNTNRPGIENVINHLHRNDDAFYKVPASTKFHDNFKAMYERLVESGEQPSFGMDSVILCSLLHDVCKIDEYEMVNGKSRHTRQYHRGGPHGLKSERLLRNWNLDLNNDERQAIIWHMGAYAHDAREIYATTYRPVASSSRLVKLIHEADHRAAKKAEKE